MLFLGKKLNSLDMYVAKARGIHPNPQKVEALTRMPLPRDGSELRSLLGGMSYYMKFIPEIVKIVRPLT
ncbi:unnamed protein product, partial [Discosporangium mesarthrocarpum]